MGKYLPGILYIRNDNAISINDSVNLPRGYSAEWRSQNVWYLIGKKKETDSEMANVC